MFPLSCAPKARSMLMASRLDSSPIRETEVPLTAVQLLLNPSTLYGASVRKHTYSKELKELSSDLKEFSEEEEKKEEEGVEKEEEGQSLKKLSDKYCFPSTMQSHRQLDVLSLVRKLSHLLISEEGVLQTELIPHLISTYLSPSAPLSKAKVHIRNQLMVLQNDPLLCSKICSVKKPVHEMAGANDVIRLACNLDAVPVTNRDAQRTVLSAFLSYMRQGKVGSCFSFFAGMNALQFAPHVTIQHLKELVEQDRITLIGKEERIELPFLMKASLGGKSQEFELSREGIIGFKGKRYGSIWKVPGIEAVGRALGVKEIRTLAIQTSELLHRRKSSSSSASKVTMEQFIELLILTFKEQTFTNRESLTTLMNRGKFAYQTQTEHPLLASWINAMAALGADQAKERERVFNAIEGALSEYGVIQGLREARPSFFANMSERWRKKAFFLFDPTLSRDHLLAGEGTSGGFSLYERSGGRSLHQWKLIGSGSALQEMIVRMVVRSISGLAGLKKDRMRKVVSSIVPCILKEDFLKSVVSRCRLEDFPPKPNRSLIPFHSKAKSDGVRHRPWVHYSGGNAKTVLEHIGVSRFVLQQLLSFTPSSPEMLLRSILELASLYDRRGVVPPSLPLIIRKIHASSIMLGHPSILKVLASPLSDDQWIQTAMVEPGLKISKRALLDGEKKEMVRLVSRLIPEDSQRDFQERLMKKMGAPFTLVSLRALLVDLLRELKHPKLIGIEGKIDALVCNQLLLKEERASLFESAIHFCDTNWYRKGLDVHFCAMFNPCTEKLEIWEMLEDSSKIYPLDNTKWVTGARWDIFPHCG